MSDETLTRHADLLSRGPSSPETRSAYYSVLSASSSQAVMLDLRFRDGNSHALGYSYLTAVSFNPSAGIRMEFVGHQVLIEGVHLDALYRGLVAHRVSWIQEDFSLSENPDTPSTLVVSRLQFASTSSP